MGAWKPFLDVCSTSFSSACFWGLPPSLVVALLWWNALNSANRLSTFTGILSAALDSRSRVLKPGGSVLLPPRLVRWNGAPGPGGLSGPLALPDGGERYPVNEGRLLRLTDQLGGRLLDPLKTTMVQKQRAMTTWALRKSIP